MRAVVLLVAASPSLFGCDESPPAATSFTVGTSSFVHAGAVVPRVPDEASGACPADMLLVEGNYCPAPVQRCLEWVDEGRYHYFRCARYEAPASCAAPRRALRFCIDRDEHVEPGQSLPQTGLPLPEADRTCKASGKRLCLESEWNFACEGERMNPYPYGFSRDSDACNADRPPLVGTDGVLVSLARAPGSSPRCTSVFGVRDLTGNVEEWVRSDRRPGGGVMKGSYWIPGKNNCRAAERTHSPLYRGVELGFRCCTDATPR